MQPLSLVPFVVAALNLPAAAPVPAEQFVCFDQASSTFFRSVCTDNARMVVCYITTYYDDFRTEVVCRPLNFAAAIGREHPMPVEVEI